MPRNIVLIGFMGTGKSVVGKRLAQRLNRPFVDVDEQIEREIGRPIRKVFAEEGESAFRQLEREMIRRVAAHDGQVIATGGGAVMDPENWDTLQRQGWIVWLKAEPDVILRRVGNVRTRPLLDVDDPRSRIDELLTLRHAAYAKADLTVDTSRRSVQDVTDEIAQQLPPSERAA